MILEAIQDAPNNTKPAKDYFCAWNETELRAAMEKDAKAVRGANSGLRHTQYGKPGPHVSAELAMRQIGRPCTILELMDHMVIGRKAATDHMRNLMLREVVTNERNEAGEVVYKLRSGYTGQKEFDLCPDV